MSDIKISLTYFWTTRNHRPHVYIDIFSSGSTPLWQQTPGGFIIRYISHFIFSSMTTILLPLTMCCVRWCAMVCVSLIWGFDSAVWLMGGWHEQCSWDEAKTFHLYPDPLTSFTYSVLSADTNTVRLFYFWLTHRWTDVGFAENGKGWYTERRKAMTSFFCHRSENEGRETRS